MNREVVETLIVDYKRPSKETYNELCQLASHGVIPDFGMTPVLCEQLVIALLRDIAEEKLCRVLKQKPNDYFVTLVTKQLALYLANNALRPQYVMQLPEVARVYFANEGLKNRLLAAYTSAGESEVDAVLINTPYQIKETVKEVLKQICPVYTVDALSTQQENTNRFIDNTICIIDEIGYLRRLSELVRSHLRYNDYDVWSVLVKDGGVCLIEHEGDYRILEWHRTNDPLRGE